MYRVFICTAILLLLLASPSVGDTITLGVGDSTVVGGLELGFNQLLLDCRCPADVVCFWEGDGVIELWAELPSVPRAAFDLHTHDSFQRSVMFGDFRITLVGLYPYPRIDTPTEPDDYTAGLSIEAVVPLDTEKTTWSRIKSLYGPTD